MVSASSASAGGILRARGQIKSRHLDFVLTDAHFRPILAVEIDGGWHASTRAMIGDDVKNGVLAAAGVPLLRLRVGSDWQAAVEDWKRAQGAPVAATPQRR